jgi:hypothetical protein
MKNLNRKNLRKVLLKELKSIKEEANKSELFMKDMQAQTITDFKEYENSEVLGETITRIWEVLDGLWQNQEIILNKVKKLESDLSSNT